MGGMSVISVSRPDRAVAACLEMSKNPAMFPFVIN